MACVKEEEVLGAANDVVVAKDVMVRGLGFRRYLAPKVRHDPFGKIHPFGTTMPILRSANLLPLFHM
jgi:hypothetical protein